MRRRSAVIRKYLHFESEPESMEWVSQYTDANMVKIDFFEARLRGGDLAARETKNGLAARLGCKTVF